MLDERTVHLRDLGLASGAHFEYAYDFGDNWQHVLEFEDEVSPAAGAVYPVCVGGECSAPPEDVGGVSGYEELLEALADPGHEEHEAMKEWLGRPFDPTAFSVADANLRLRKRPRLSNKR